MKPKSKRNKEEGKKKRWRSTVLNYLCWRGLIIKQYIVNSK